MRRPSKDLALKFLNDAEEFLSKGDLVQACEKYYKAAEEAIKLLVIENNLKEIINDVESKGRWESENLFKASKLLRSNNPEIPILWKSAWTLHVEGFHELSLTRRKLKNLRKMLRN
ncbi:PaREP1 family protein [Sulfolobus islandicus HVE10/4]|uniref:PaREP1 family protein n=1 Tax=Saccharolobus islandicus (strain HVE10/4) TaxID=930943 RepID=F0NMH7_SACI0|nr:PaREP1 family protein [Sulfolobus islandicus]ADX83921.1 PaREP1 family protein [Sulfolobus islandicus HVE10/4]